MGAVRFDLFSSNRLYRALEEAGYPDLPAERTVRDWIKNDSAPDGARIYAAKALGIENEPPPSEWARAVAEATANEVIGRLVPPELLAAAHRLLAGLAELEPPSDEATHEGRGQRDRVE